jgi:hypothetical protein
MSDENQGKTQRNLVVSDENHRMSEENHGMSEEKHGMSEHGLSVYVE